jgi:hypothetical protein
MDNEKKLQIKIAKRIGLLLFIILVVELISNKILLPNPRIIFWVLGVTGILIFGLLFLISLLLHITSPNVQYEKYLKLTKSLVRVEIRISNYLEVCNKNNVSELTGFIVILAMYVVFSLAAYFVIWGR